MTVGPGSDEIDDMTRFVSPAERAAAQAPPPAYQQPGYHPHAYPPQAYAPHGYPPQTFQPPPREQIRGGSTLGGILLALTLFVVAVLGLANIGFAGEIGVWWQGVLADLGINYQWAFSLPSLLLLAGFAVAALVSSRAWSRAPGVLASLLLIVVAYFLLSIAVEIGIVNTRGIADVLSRGSGGLIVAFAAAAWLLAKRRRAVAAWAALIGLPLGVAANWIYVDHWGEEYLYGSAAQYDQRTILWWSESGLWVLIVCTVVTVWLGVLADSMMKAKPAAY